jgi:predicted Zn finger-like uncharacterized protein
MAVQTQCPNCRTTYKLADATLGKKVRCKNCMEPFTVQPTAGAATNVLEVTPLDAHDDRIAPVARRPAPVIKACLADDYDEDDDLPRSRRPRRRRQSGDTPILLIAGLVGGGLLFLFLLIVGVAILLPVIAHRSAQTPAPPATQTPPAPAAGPTTQPANPAPVASQQPPNMPPVVPPGFPNVRPAFPGQPSGSVSITLTRATFSMLGARMSFNIEYRLDSGQPTTLDHCYVIIKSARGDRYEGRLAHGLGQQGTIHLTGISFPFRGGRDNGPFQVHIETGGFGRLGPRRTVSNTISTN